jgi:hypothetical protein
MDTSCNREQDRNHDFKRRCFNDSDNDNDDDNDDDNENDRISYRTPPSSGIRSHAVGRDPYDNAAAGLRPTGCRPHMV